MSTPQEPAWAQFVDSLEGNAGSMPEASLSVSMDLRRRILPPAKILVFANEKGGVGKSTLAFHCCAALVNAGKQVLAFDIDHRQQSLANALSHREVTARRLGVPLGRPRHLNLAQHSTGMLVQEMHRLGARCDYIIIDIGGEDSRLARRAIALADTLVTPVNYSFVDLALLGSFDPITYKLRELGYFAKLVNQLQDVREGLRRNRADWIVVPNRQNRRSSHNNAHITRALEVLSAQAGFRLVDGLSDRAAYRELFLLGLTVLDLSLIPELGRAGTPALREVKNLMSILGLPGD